MGQPRFRHSLRFKLALASLTLLAIPWAGYRYLQETEDSLRQAQEALLLSRAEVVAGVLTNQMPQLNGRNAGKSLYVHPLPQPALVDGYAEEWDDLLTQARRYRASETTPDAIRFDLLAGYHERDIYLLVRVHDRTLAYPRPGEPLTTGDHLLLALPGEGAKSRQYRIGTSAPGWLTVEPLNGGSERAIRGEWQESAEGYTVELRLPLAMAEQGLSLAVIDRAQGREGIQGIASTSGWQRNDQLAQLVMPSLPSGTLLQGLDSRTHRYTILNRQRQVVGRHGTLATDSGEPRTLSQRLLGLLLSRPGSESAATREHAGRMDGPEIRRALDGKPAIYRYADTRANTLSAAYPLTNRGETVGAILVEQTTGNILLLQRQALEGLLGTSLILFLITAGTLFLLATWLTGRISRLNRKFNRAVSHDGRVMKAVKGSNDTDELGDLDRSFASVLQRLQAYNHYLEQMASRLAHEFRTPLAMVQSSLENLQADDTPETRKRYTERALEGTQRLHLILNRLREATRLEQALQSAEMIRLDLSELCKGLCEGYRLSNPQVTFQCEIPDTSIEVMAAPELIGQALDKLISNAIDFHTEGTPIRLTINTCGDHQVQIAVENQGSPLPKDMEHALFASMVSVRDKNGNEPHLGLGLYLVKLIVEFHNGEAGAKNLVNGVRFSLLLACEL
ncbi:MAG: histidine kinase dimerization/phospho-acceptor domain-containing protein [Candidatus Thiodiazotropha sp.]